MAVGEAHWQNGIVERHIGTFREMLNTLMLEDVFEGADNQTFVDNACEAKNRNGSYIGTSPSQWLLGRSRHPLIDTAEASPMITSGSAFEEHLARTPSQHNNFMQLTRNISYIWRQEPDLVSYQKYKRDNWFIISVAAIRKLN